MKCVGGYITSSAKWRFIEGCWYAEAGVHHFYGGGDVDEANGRFEKHYSPFVGAINDDKVADQWDRVMEVFYCVREMDRACPNFAEGELSQKGVEIKCVSSLSSSSSYEVLISFAHEPF